MKLLPSFDKFFGGLLSNPGDSLLAKVSPTGKQIVKISTEQVKRTIVRYPEKGTIVETIVHKVKK